MNSNVENNSSLCIAVKFSSNATDPVSHGTTARVLCALLGSIIVIFGITLNAIALIVVAKSKKLHTVPYSITGYIRDFSVV